MSFKENDRVMLVRLGILGVILSLGGTLALSENLVCMVVGIVLLGSMYAHAVELHHQCLHYSAFSARALNRMVGTALGLPTLTSFSAYRRSHMDHHRRLGTSADTPFFNYRSVSDPSFMTVAHDLLGVSHLATSVRAIFAVAEGRMAHTQSLSEAERFEFGLMGFLLVLAALSAMYFGPSPILRLWLIPAVLVAQPIHFLIELPEHLGCNNQTTDVLRNTRTIVGSRFSRWFTNGNNFHVEHHLEPAVPMHELGAVFQRLAGRPRFITTSYWQFYKSLFRTVATRPPVATVAADYHGRTI